MMTKPNKKYLFWKIVVATTVVIVPIILNWIFEDFKPSLWLKLNFVIYALLVIFIWYSIEKYLENKDLVEENEHLENVEKKELEIENKKLKNEVKKFEKPDIEKIKYLRFEEIKAKNEFVFGHIDYEPFFKMRKKVGTILSKPCGIGYAVLKEIFLALNVRIKEYSESGDWENIFEKLVEKEYDIIVTPLYETRTRIYKYPIIYCIPLFYSEVGLFVHEADFEGTKSTKEVKEELELEPNKWESPFISGEISELIAKKLKCVSKNDDAKVQDGPQAYLNLLKKVNNRNPKSNDNKYTIVAMEVFKAKATMDRYNQELDLTQDENRKKKLALKNILHEKQLLYPVSFVVRKEDTALRNFINLRIAELYEQTPLERDLNGEIINKDGTKSLIDIIKEEAKVEDGIEPHEIDHMFIQTYDFSNLGEYSRY